MKPQSYYRELFPKIHNGDFEITDEPLVVNCTGFWRRIPDDKPIYSGSEHGRRDYYLMYITEGVISARLGGVDVPFSKGEFIIYSPHTMYYHDFYVGESMEYLWLHFTGFHARRLLSQLGLQPNCIHKTDGSNGQLEVLYSLFERMFGEMANRRFGFDGVCSGILNELLVTLARSVSGADARDKRTLASIAYLHRHFKENTPLEQLAAMESLSISRYRDVFKAQTGFSPVDYRTMLRLQHACELLVQSSCTMTEVALECGYTDVYYFLRIFKAKEGMTPGEYRARARG